MRKLQILKSLIDFIWIVTCLPLALFLVGITIYSFINSDVLLIIFKDTQLRALDAKGLAPYVILVTCLAALLIMYCVFLFRKTLRYFQQLQPFHDRVISNFYTIGKLLILTGIFSMILYFLIHLSVSRFTINLGVSPQLLVICLGLFFMVLSEVFKVAKYAKEENDLTI